ncbi:hypothetical protein VNI00_007446 [Paramarasmius palmivorus]|uniref:Uncharacterized protein n=1 Tax=Paramarasmius palmivorus TaxID=297713 RepID=A0AAW0D283_9AGAR
MQGHVVLPEPFSQITDHLGTSTFFPALVKHIQNASPSLPIEPVILQSILLCLVAGDKHLILRTAEDDVGLVSRLAVKTLSTIFGRVTHRLRVKRTSESHYSVNPNAFLRTLFLPANNAASSSIYNSQDESSTLAGKKSKKRSKRITSRSRSRNASSRNRNAHRSVSYPNDLPQIKPSPSITPSDPFGDHHSPHSPPQRTSNPFTIGKSSFPSPMFIHSHSDPTPLRLRDLVNPQLPNALVISGLENASHLSQSALTSVLIERRVILEGSETGEASDSRRNSHLLDEPLFEEADGVWPLPDDFIVIYVCPLDEWERPPIQKSLLDRFAMSATVNLDPSVRAAATVIFRPLSFRNSPVLSPVPLSPASSYTPTSSPPYFSQPLPSRTWSPGLQAAINNAAPLLNTQFIKLLQLVYSRVHFAPTLNLYLADLMSAVRHHPQLEGRLLTANAMKDAIDLTRACRVLSGDPTGMELIQDLLADQIEDLDLQSRPNGDAATSALEDIGNGNVTILNPAPFVSGGGAEEDAGEDEHIPIPILEVSQADIGRIIPRVVSHRIRVRNGPQEEVLASAMFGATLPTSEEYSNLVRGRQTDRKGKGLRCTTVKDVLISILSEV